MAMLSQQGATAQKPQALVGLSQSSGVQLLPSFPNTNTNDPAALFKGLDPSSSKQLAALTAAGHARRATQVGAGGTSGSFVGGIQHPQHPPFRPASSIGGHDQPMQSHQAQPIIGDNSFLQRQSAMPSQSAAPQVSKEHQTGFLANVAKVWLARNRPLPPAITGFPTQYDPQTSPWKSLEPASEVGGFKLAGKDVDLFKLWTLVHRFGGPQKVHHNHLWNSILPHLGLSERMPGPPESNTPTASVLASLYNTILGPVDEAYMTTMNERRRQMAQQQQQAGASQQMRLQSFPPNGQLSSANGIPSGSIHNNQHAATGGPGSPAPFAGQASPHTPQIPMRPSSGMLGALQGQTGHSMPSITNGIAHPGQVATSSAFAVSPEYDLNSEARKRKINIIEEDMKRARRKLEAEQSTALRVENGDPVASTSTASGSSSSARPRPMRRKIEYVPLAREIETAGGRDMNHIRGEYARLLQGKVLRSIDEWGRVHVDSLTMSLRSRLSVELSYALTTLTIISTMRIGTPDSGFPVAQAQECLEELMDFLEEVAFDGTPEEDSDLDYTSELITSRQLLTCANEEEETHFASTDRQGQYDPTGIGPTQRRGDLVRITVNIFRNLSAITDNQAALAQHPTLTALLLRLTGAKSLPDGRICAASPVLSLPDLIVIRKDVLYTMVNLAGSVDLKSPAVSAAEQHRKARRVFELAASFLVDPGESLSPFAWAIQSGVQIGPHIRVPLFADAALELFTRISQPDSNRQIIADIVPKSWLTLLFESVIHRLPTVEQDFHIIVREEAWISYMEKLAMAFYSLAFLMPPDLKKKLKSDSSLCFSKIVLRMIRRVMDEKMRPIYHVCVRRVIEAMKLMDDCSDSFDVSQPSIPQLSFGVGYGEVGDERVEKGTGLWGGHRDDILWGVMLTRDMDDVVFSELESLVRVECTT